MTQFINSTCAKRLLKDIKDIYKNPLEDNGIYYKHDENNMVKGAALIIGTNDTPYFNGFYLFEFDFPEDYPFKPPTVTFKTTNGIRMHPNLYINGKVCISLLNTWKGEQWTACQTISSVLLTLCGILTQKPLLHEPGITTGHPDFKHYTTIIEYYNIQIAICDILNKKINIDKIFYDHFYDIMCTHFIKNYDNIYNIITTLINKHKRPFSLSTSMYHINTTINYTDLLNQIKDIKQNVISTETNITLSNNLF